MTKIIMTLIEAIRAYNVSECVRGYAGEIEPSFCISEDLNVWAGREVCTVADLEEWLNYSLGFSDYYKEVNGFRPRWDTDSYTLTDWRSEYASLNAEAEREAEEQRQRDDAFEQRIQDTIRLGAGDRATALRWIVESLGWDDPWDCAYGGSSACYHLNISWRFKEELEPIVLAFGRVLHDRKAA